MQLFELKDYNLTFSPQALELKAFKALWDRDKTKDKKRALAELSYVYFFSDYKSDFIDILDETTRHSEIVLNLSGLPKEWKPDDKVKDAIRFYTETSETISTRLLEDSRKAVNKVSDFLKNVDLNLVDKNGKPIHDVARITQAIKSVPTMTKALKDLEEQVKKEKDAESSLRGSKEKSIFEDGI